MAFEDQENDNVYQGLEELSNSDYEIKDGEPDITGWGVFNQQGDKIGEVDDLLFDAQARKVRYIVLELQANGLDVLGDDKRVLVPIGVATLHPNDDDVVLPIDSATILSGLPEYDAETFGPEYEVDVRNIFDDSGSTAPYEHPQFYQHQHFDEDKFYNRGAVLAEGTEDTELTDVTEEDPEDEAARAQRVSRIIERINRKQDNV
ncbi:PRC-barrel domain-containing protein [Mucilaginibacter myungsuensis]|uniref:PRC-barrel domain-containing protein n=1 Tax=Mucilaginibacter myungsuensis TaxID=649104 RepID=A0A929L0X7_9SPHI|nr:PRC-barrel domain-containing protein [Mucilaginibacter myungsuensis]MBE9662100.1 PRC-barrel domain-containing protein [Mucilaginibacter myungsuensis]MDN3599466.1 PRC-barrel domain-containing protein [Mucilaginibacter myungsuensis]